MKKALAAFPGQGSQKLMMCKDLYSYNSNIKSIFEEANDTLGYSISNIMFGDNLPLLSSTENAQPAILLGSYSILKMLQGEGFDTSKYIQATAGHSLGEYSALVCAGSLSFKDAISLVHQRGKIMKAAYPTGGSMVAVLGLDSKNIQETIDSLNFSAPDICVIANDNCPGQIVISGSSDAVSKASDAIKERGAKRLIPLETSGPFHSPLMKGASKDLELELSKITINKANTPIVQNATAQDAIDPLVIKENLIYQIYRPVRWVESMEYAFNNFDIDTNIEIGFGNVLSGLCKKINNQINLVNLNSVDSVLKFMDNLKI